MKQSEFQELVINEFKEQKKFNELFSKRLDSIEYRLTSVEKRLDSIEYRLTRLESFHQKDIDNYESKK